MNFYDEINSLTSNFKQTEEYKKFISLKNKIKEDKDTYNMLKEFKDGQSKQQMMYMEKGNVDENLKKELENTYSILIKNDDVRALLEQEMKLNIIVVDIQKALGEAVKEITDF